MWFHQIKCTVLSAVDCVCLHAQDSLLLDPFCMESNGNFVPSEGNLSSYTQVCNKHSETME